MNNHASEQAGKNTFQPAKISTLARKIRLNSWQSDNNNILRRLDYWDIFNYLKWSYNLVFFVLCLYKRK